MLGFKFFFKTPESANKQLYAKRPTLQKYVENSFLLKGTNGKGVLFIHGWSCTPYESYWLAQFLNRRGYTIYSILLSGHGKTPSDLNGVKAKNWIQDTQKGYEELQKYSKEIFIMGNSMGGNLAILLAAKFTKIKGLILVGTPYKMKNEFISRIFAWAEKNMKNFTKKHYAKEYYIFLKKKQHYLAYPSYPTSSPGEAFKIIRKSRQVIKKVQQPVLLLQSKEDHVIVENNTELFFSKLKNPLKKEINIPDVYHNFFGNPNDDAVFYQIYNFLEEIIEKE